MRRFHRGRHQWEERNVAVDRRHRWPALSTTGIVVGSVELIGTTFVAYNISGNPVGKFASLTDARQALVMQRR
jgi:hypothetical protein